MGDRTDNDLNFEVRINHEGDKDDGLSDCSSSMVSQALILWHLSNSPTEAGDGIQTKKSSIYNAAITAY